MSDTGRIIVVGLVLCMIIITFYWKKSERAKKHKEKLEKYKIKSDASVDSVLHYHDKENEILIRIAEAEREVNAKLDNKIAMLNLLIEEADKKVLELKTLQNQPTMKQPDSSNIKEVPKQEQVYQKIRQLNEAGLSAAEIAGHMKMMEGEVNLILSLLRKKRDG